MRKKIVLTLVVAALCLSSFGVLAAKGENSKEKETEQETVVNAVYGGKEVKEGKDKTVSGDVYDDKSKDENNGKSKIIKDELAAKKQERSEARLEAKEFFKQIREMFNEADPATKKEILKEIASVKRELKDFSIGVFVKGLAVDFDKYDGVKPLIKEDRTLVPVRAITETLGAVVDWNEETSTITITKDATTIIMQLDNKIATVNGEEVELDVAPTTEKGRTLVPIRFISETLKLGVNWDEESQTVLIEE